MDSYGEKLCLKIFGQSHSEKIGMTLEGFPAEQKIDFEKLNGFLSRRAPGRNKYSTPRKEDDIPQFLSGLKDGKTTGEKIEAVIYNKNIRPGDYDKFKNIPRPSHADYTAHIKYAGAKDVSGGGQFSGRLTAPMCIAGGMCLQALEQENVQIFARIKSIGNIEDTAPIEKVDKKEFPIVTDSIAEQMLSLIDKAREEGDSVGGVIECAIEGLPIGIGGPLFEGMEGKIAQAVFAIPAVKGIEFGLGFGSAKLFGSQNNDEFCIKDGKIQTKTNNCGGILGGITNGMPLTFSVAIKPTPSIAKEQKSVDLQTNSETTLKITGRHDPCVVHRAVPCVEAAAAIAIYDAILAFKEE